MPDRSDAKGVARRAAYTAAGVDVAAGERAVDLMRPAVETTRRPEVVGIAGGFAGAFAIPAGYREPLIVASSDGVGTKTAIAMALGRHETIGQDLVAMCVDDLVCCGAEPVAFLDYLALGVLDPAMAASIVGGIAAACRLAGCALLGGETAEHPGLMEPGTFDLAGTAIGVVERSELLDGSAVRPGDRIVGLAASGLHANGYSLVRAVIGDAGLALDAPYQTQLRRALATAGETTRVAVEPQHEMATLGDVLLEPTRIYARAVLGARARLRARGLDLHGAAHVTGGGLPGNVPRALPPGLSARIDPDRWLMPSVMRMVAALGRLDDTEIRATFNGGIGMILVVPDAAPALDDLLAWLAAEGCPGTVIGEVFAGDAPGGARYVEGPLS